MQDFLKSFVRIKNLTEDRESKLYQLLKLARENNLAEYEEKGVPLMLSIRRSCERLAREIRMGACAMVNESMRGWQGMYRYVESQAYPQLRGKCYMCHLK